MALVYRCTLLDVDTRSQQVTGKDGGPIAYQSIDAPAKETREEWLARQTKGEQPSLH